MTKLSPKSVREMLAEETIDARADALAGQLLDVVGRDALVKGIQRSEETTVLWAIQVEGSVPPVLVTRTYEEEGSAWQVWEAPQPEPRPDILATDVTRWPMQRIGRSDLYIAARELPNFSATAYRYEVGERRCGDGWVVLEHYPPEPDCLPRPGVPRGTVSEYLLRESAVYPGTVRGYWVYVPAQYEPDGSPACLMVFQDGGMYLEPPAPVPTVLDNLIHKGEIPVTIGVFVNPGTFPAQEGRFQNRSVEYDTLSDQYARFLRDEMIPEVSKRVNLRGNAASHAICGISSGAVCAFTAAWEMPDLFSKVLCHVGSFTNIRGAHEYPFRIRRTPQKPIRVYLQDGTNDIDDVCGNWPLANRQMAAALKFRGYDYKLDFGRGFHSLAHGGATLPSALRWLWQGYEAE